MHPLVALTFKLATSSSSNLIRERKLASACSNPFKIKINLVYKRIRMSHTGADRVLFTCCSLNSLS